MQQSVHLLMWQEVQNADKVLQIWTIPGPLDDDVMRSLSQMIQLQQAAQLEGLHRQAHAQMHVL